VVIGAGFIGLEMTENLAKRGLQVTIIEKAPHVLPPLDQEMAAFVQEELVKNGVRVITSQSATRFEDQGKVIVLENGQKITSDLTILSVGVEPENGLAKAAGIELGLRGGILVVIGAGFIGLEMTENLAKRGLQVTIIEKAPHVL
ncbi:NAD(P)-binding protein, partial [Mycobacterium tuberculosis]|nr:NAD(P)-binding protein [Mycobacterium tuberculosis]